MSSANVGRMARRLTTPQSDVDAELRHIQDLVFVRDLLASRGAPRAEISECDAVIDAVRRRLAVTAKRASARYAAPVAA